MPDLSPQHALELVTPAVANPILLSEAKAQLRVEHNDDDVIIARLINVAVAYVDATGALGACMMTQTWGQWVKQNPGTVTLLLGPVQSVSAIKYYDVNNALQTDTLSKYNVLGRGFRVIVIAYWSGVLFQFSSFVMVNPDAKPINWMLTCFTAC